jgi:ATP-dependent Clp protease adapter protein ClpS
MVPTYIVRIIGSVLLLFGIGLAILAIFAVERQLTVPGTLMTGVLVPVILGLISAFCLPVGCRLLFNRPAANGSILSPLGWRVLAITFYAICVASIAGAASKGEYPFLLLALGLGALGYGSLKAARTSRFGTMPSHLFPPDTSLITMPGFLPEGFRCGIEILNDDRTPMEFVVSILESLAGMSKLQAMRTMLAIHKKGGIVLPMQSSEQSKHVAELIVTEARAKNHPLVCRAVSLE